MEEIIVVEVFVGKLSGAAARTLFERKNVDNKYIERVLWKLQQKCRNTTHTGGS